MPAAHAWPYLRAAAAAFCPPLEIVREDPGLLGILLRDPRGDDQIRLGYRSQRGLFLRTLFLVVVAEIPGVGPAEAGDLRLRLRRLAWRGRAPKGGERWPDRLSSTGFHEALRALQVERLTLRWRPERSAWLLLLETLSGSLTVTFFPPLVTPNPLERKEAEAIRRLLESVRRAASTSDG